MNNISDDLGIPDWEFRVVVGRTRIDYDPNKDRTNLEKHGYSLVDAVTLLERMLLPIGFPPPCMTSEGFLENGEVRHIHMGVDNLGKVVLMATTIRPEETVRVISFRRASTDERDQFAQVTGFREPAAGA